MTTDQQKEINAMRKSIDQLEAWLIIQGTSKSEPLEWPQEGDEVWRSNGHMKAVVNIYKADSAFIFKAELLRGRIFPTEAECLRDDQRRRATTLLQSIADRQGEVDWRPQITKYSLEIDTNKSEWYFITAGKMRRQGTIYFKSEPDLDAIQKEFEAAGLKMDWLL